MFTKITYLKNATSYVEAQGKLDIYNAPDYLEEIKEHINKLHPKDVILEFSNISYVASIGLRTILELHKIMIRRSGHLILKNVNEEILYAFKFTGFDKFLTIDNESDTGEDTAS